MRTWVYSFRDRFASLVETGAKCQTIRQNRKDLARPQLDDTIKCFKGLRTKYTRLLKVGTTIECLNVRIDFRSRTIWLSGCLLLPREADAFAKSDGFEHAAEMIHWFVLAYGQNNEKWFEGYCVKWRPTESQSSFSNPRE